MNVLITPNDISLFTNIGQINSINTKQKSIIIENGYYRLFEILVNLNQIENTQFELSSFTDSFECIFSRTVYTIDFQKHIIHMM